MGSGSQYRYRPLGLFRLVLALLVVIQHAVANSAPLGWLYDTVIPYELGSLAVLVFFCLSGFVITEAASRIYHSKPWAFLTNRLLRIVPHYLVAVFIAVGIHGLFQAFGTLRISDRLHPLLSVPDAFSMRNIAGNLIGFLPGAGKLMAFDFVDVIWAVRIEMVFYLAVFGLLLLPNRRWLPRLIPYGLIGLGILTLLVARQFGYFFFFLYGVMLYDWRRYRSSLLLSILGMGLYFVRIPLYPDAGYHREVIAQGIILTGMIGVMTGLLFRSGRPQSIDQRAGDLSYPLYVHHQNMLVLALSLTTGYSYGMMTGGVIMAIALSYGLLCVVDPVVNRFRDAIRGKILPNSDHL